MATLDPELEALLSRINKFREGANADTHSAADVQQVLNIAVSFTGPVDPLITAGFKPGSLFSSTAYGTILLADLAKLAAVPTVTSISKQRRKRLQLSTSVPDIRADEVWDLSGEAFTGITGKNAIVGIIDTGINFQHESFRTATGLSRILRIWDQTLTPTGTETSPDPVTDPAIGSHSLNYGVEYTQTQINQTLQNVNSFVRHEDKHGHGTHVAGIAAGSGRQAGSCKGRYTFIGVAPEADIIAVRLWGLTPGDGDSPPTTGSTMIDAICYMLNHAKHSFNKPISINLSLGLFSEKMDGSSEDCTTMNGLLNHADNDEGFAIVFAAGNEADSGFHAKTTLAAGETAFRLQFRVYPNDERQRHIVILYDGGTPEVKLTSPVSGTDGIIDWVAPGASDESETANGSNPSNPTLIPKVIVNNTSANRITISIIPKIQRNADGTVDNSVSRYNIPDDWLIELKNTGATDSTIDAYCLYGSGHDRKSIHFLNDTTPQTTLSEESTAAEVITVGSYNASNGALAASSGRGMTSDLRLKPELTAPGVGIMSAGIAQDLEHPGCCCDCCHDYYVTKGGTSMAAPHVAGAAALLLDKNPNLTHSQILNELVSHARPKPSGLPLDEDLGWGTGKLDVKAAIDPVTAGGGSPSGPHALFYKSRGPAQDTQSLYEEFRRSKRGQEYLKLFHTYFREIRTLINRNKKVATVWHRSGGPQWLRTAIQAAQVPAMILPEVIEGFSLREAIDRMLHILKKYGSQDLVTDLDKYEEALHEIRGGLNLFQLMEQVAYPADLSIK